MNIFNKYSTLDNIDESETKILCILIVKVDYICAIDNEYTGQNMIKDGQNYKVYEKYHSFIKYWNR